MDGIRFDRLVRAWLRAGTRRTLVGSLAALPIGGIASMLADPAPSGAKRRDRHPRAERGDTGDERLSRKARCRRRKGKGRGHHGRRKQCQARHGGHRKKHEKMPCQPESLAETCAGRCGEVVNTCQQEVDCGSCVCDPPCAVCRICDESSGACAPDPLQAGEACGEPGQVCQDTGDCACEETSCAPCQTCQGNGLCSDPCNGSGCCASGTCELGTSDTACGRNGEPCQSCIGTGVTCGGGGTEGVCGCTPENPCTAGVCGTVVNNCGDAVICGGCSGSTPICVNNVCVPCDGAHPCPGSDLCCGGECVSGICCVAADCTPIGNACDNHQCQCGGGAACAGAPELCCGGACTDTDTDENNCGACGNVCSGDMPVCWDGTCVCGDVCADGCQFSTVADAVAAALPGATITICAGEYRTNVGLVNDITIRGAGAGVTILNGGGSDRVIVTGPAAVYNIQDLTITGGNGFNGGGIFNRGQTTLTRVHVTDNVTAGGRGGGIINVGGSALLVLDDSDVTFNTAGVGGGISNEPGGAVRLTNGSTVTNNTAIDLAGGIYNFDGSDTVTLEPGTLVCDNSEPQCNGFTPPSGFCGACPP